jgi:hypothetical protein
MPFIAWVALATVAFIALIFLERWRQVRNLRARGEKVSDRPGMLGASALELQRMLEPERKVEILQKEARGEEVGETEQEEETET